MLLTHWADNNDNTNKQNLRSAQPRITSLQTDLVWCYKIVIGSGPWAPRFRGGLGWHEFF